MDVGETPAGTKRSRISEEVIQIAIRLALLAGLIYWSFILLSPFIPILLWSVVLAVALYPVYEWLSAHLETARASPLSSSPLLCLRSSSGRRHGSAPVASGTTYVFDKGYCDFGWWRKINDGGAFFVTRAKTNLRLRVRSWRQRARVTGDGFTVLDDAEVVYVSKGNARLPIPLRRIRVKRDQGGKITLLTNDCMRSAVEIAALYKSRWQIELLFRWIKQHLRLRKFLGNNENAIRLQILAAMIAYLLLRIAARLHRIMLPPLRFAELVGQRLFLRRSIAEIDKPPPCNPSQPQRRLSPNQLEFGYV